MRRLPTRCCIAPAASRSRAPPRGMPAPAALEPCLSDGALEPDPHGPGRTPPGHAAHAHSLLSQSALTLLAVPMSVRRSCEINILSELNHFFLRYYLPPRVASLQQQLAHWVRAARLPPRVPKRDPYL